MTVISFHGQFVCISIGPWSGKNNYCNFTWKKWKKKENMLFVFRWTKVKNAHIGIYRRGVSTSPVVFDGFVCIGRRDHHVYLIDAHTGNIIWSYEILDTVSQKSVITNSSVNFNCDNRFQSIIDTHTGTTKKGNHFFPRINSDPVVNATKIILWNNIIMHY